MTNEATPEIDWPELIHQLLELVIPRSDDIMESSVKLGSLLTIGMQLAEIEPLVRERAATLALQKHEIPGWTLVHREGNRYVEAQQLIEICLQCPVSNLEKVLRTLVLQQGNVSERRYQELCDSAGVRPLKDSAKQTGATVFLRRNPTNN